VSPSLPPALVDILRHIAREEPLTGTVRAFPGMTREEMGRLLEAAAHHLTEAPAEPDAPPPDSVPRRPRRTSR
jgi:ribonuclease HI